MELFIKSGDILSSAQELSKMAGNKVIGGRSAIATSNVEAGITNTNAISSIPTLLHVLYDKFTLPANNDEFNTWQEQNRYIKSKLTTIPKYIAANNEIYYTAGTPMYDHNMQMVANMNIFLRSLYYENDTMVLTSGIGTGICRALVEKYYTEKGMKKKLTDFQQRIVGGTAVYQPYMPGADDFCTEVNLYKQAGIVRLCTNVHFNISSENINCFAECIQAVKYFSQPYDVVVGELSFHEQDTKLVTEAMTIIKDAHIKMVGGYDGTAPTQANRAAPWTQAMKRAFASFAI